MTLVWRPGYQVPFPESPVDQEEWTDINTSKTWVYDSATDTWSEVVP